MLLSQLSLSYPLEGPLQLGTELSLADNLRASFLAARLARTDDRSSSDCWFDDFGDKGASKSISNGFAMVYESS